MTSRLPRVFARTAAAGLAATACGAALALNQATVVAAPRDRGGDFAQ